MPKTTRQGPVTTADIEELLRTPGSTLLKILGIEASQIWSQRLIELNHFIEEIQRQIHTDFALWKSQHTVSQGWGLSPSDELKMRNTLETITAYQKESTVLYTQLVTAKEQLEILINHRNDYVNTMPQAWREQREAQTKTLCVGLAPILSEMAEQKIAAERAKNIHLSDEQIKKIKHIYKITSVDVEVLNSVHKPQELVLMKDSPVPADTAPESAMFKYDINAQLAAARVLLAKDEGLDNPHNFERLLPSQLKKMQASKAGDVINKNYKEFREQDIKKMVDIHDVLQKFDGEINMQNNKIEDIEKQLSDLAAKIKLNQDQIAQLRQRPSMKPK